MPDQLPPAGAAFLLTQLGTTAARRFAEQVATLDLTPPQAGLLRAIAAEAGQSQQELAAHLGTPAPRLVALVDALEERGVVERKRNPHDRRTHAVHLTESGRSLLSDVGRVARAHEEAVLADLDVDERRTLVGLLSRLAEAHGLRPGVYPGYRTLS